MSNGKWDWKALEDEYVSSDISLRELARKHGIANHSNVMEHSVSGGWRAKREAFQTRAEQKALAMMADGEGRRRFREAEVRDNAIDAIDEAITKMRADMKATHRVFKGGEFTEEPLVVIRPQDVALLIDRLQVLFGKPSNITEERNLGIQLSSGNLDPELLRGIVEATRGIAGPGTSGGSPIPRLDRAGTN